MYCIEFQHVCNPIWLTSKRDSHTCQNCCWGNGPANSIITWKKCTICHILWHIMKKWLSWMIRWKLHLLDTLLSDWFPPIKIKLWTILTKIGNKIVSHFQLVARWILFYLTKFIIYVVHYKVVKIVSITKNSQDYKQDCALSSFASKTKRKKANFI